MQNTSFFLGEKNFTKTLKCSSLCVFNECVAVIWLRRAENSITTFRIKKKINTELFIDGKHELYTYNNKGRIKEGDGTSWREVTKIGLGGNENQLR